MNQKKTKNSESIDVRSCGVIVFREQPRKSFLLMRHIDRWDLPKGHIDPGETDKQCALRELVEETGINESDIKLDSDFRFVHQYWISKDRKKPVHKLKELVIYLGWLLRDVEIELTEHADYACYDWDPPHTIQKKTIDPLLAAINEFFERIEK